MLSDVPFHSVPFHLDLHALWEQARRVSHVSVTFSLVSSTLFVVWLVVEVGYVILPACAFRRGLGCLCGFARIVHSWVTTCAVFLVARSFLFLLGRVLA